MPAFGIFARDPVDLAKRAHLLKTVLLTCLFAAWPLAASAGAPSATAAAQERIAVSRTAPADANDPDPLWRWFREQDKLLDDILTRLARVEGLVGDIHRLVSSMPDRAAATPAKPAAVSAPATPAAAPSAAPAITPAITPAPTAAPKPAVQTPVQPKPARPPVPDFDDEDEEDSSFVSRWSMPLAAGAVLLLLLLLLWARKRGAAASAAKPGGKPVKATAAMPTAVTPAPTSVVPAAVAPAPAGTKKTVESANLPPDALEPVSEQADQALELAEIMLSMGLGHGAAQTLAEQIRNEPKQALRHWLRLLEIYRKNGQQEEFERSAEELRQHFNVKPEDWHEQPDALRSIEDYPHIANRLTELWGRPACLVYLHNLLADNRGGSRSGFPQSVAEELLLLTAMLRDGGIVS